jgi:hypothetical protein
MKRNPLRSKGWLLALVFLLVFQACTQIRSPLETATPEGEAQGGLMPDLDLPPAVVEFTPRPGQELAPDDVVIKVRFDQDMDQESVTGALQVSPPLEGEVSWPNERTLSFRPQGLAAATRYHVSLSPEAQSAEGQMLGQPLAFTFSTVGPLQVTRVSPEAGADDVRVDAPLLVAFNRPVVPVNCTGAIAGKIDECPALSLTFSPPINGEGFWVNTSLYRFTPRLGWDAGRVYRVELESGITSIAGATMDESYTWSFSAALPRILDVQPPIDGEDVPLETGVVVAFNTPMDPEATGSAFSLISEVGEPVPGGLTWRDNGAILVFTPTQQLELGTRYLLRLGERARALTGAPIEAPLESTFTTVPYPAPLSIVPPDGAQGVSLYDSVRVAFAGAISPTTVLPHVVVTPSIAAEDLYTYWSGDVLNLSWEEKEPRTEYCVRVEPGILDRYGNATTTSVATCFTTGDLPAVFAPATGGNAVTLDATQPAEIYVVSRNVARASLSLLSMTERDFIGAREIVGTEVRSWTETPGGEANQAQIRPLGLTRQGTSLSTGYYGLRWSTPEDEGWRQDLRIAVVDRHVTLKVATEEALVWVTDLQSGEPVAGAEVRLLDEQGTLIAGATTDSQGIARTPIEARENLWDRVAAVVGRPGEEGFGVALTGWNANVTPWEFGIDVDYGGKAPYHLYLYSDRPIYRPGQTVRVRGILREETDVRYSLPDLQQSIEIRLRDVDWNVVTTNTVTLSEIGGFDTAFELSQGAAVGLYSVEALVPGVERVWQLPFAVAAYRKPEFEVNVTPERDDILQGETLRAVVDARYYFGGPVSNAAVAWEVRVSPAFFHPPVEGGWSWGPSGGFALRREVIASGEATTDGEGRVLLEIPAELVQPENDEPPSSQEWEIEVTVTDESGFPVTNRAPVTVHATRFYLGLQPREWVVSAGEKTTVDLLALDWEGAPVPGQEVEVTLAQREWYRERTEEPFSPPRWTYTDTVVSTLNVTTDGDGGAEAVVTPSKGGSYVLLAETTDEDGRPVRAEVALWVSGPEGAAWQLAQGEITPVADLQRYSPGDTASILLPTPFEAPFQVLMTLERGGILEVQQFEATEANPIVELPITARYAPNVYVSFVVVQGAEGEEGGPPDVRVGMVELVVEPVAQTLEVALTTDQSRSYLPGEDVSLTVRTVDSAGRTVDAEVGLAVVDKAVLALQEPNAPSIVDGFYGERPLGVVMGDSLLVSLERIAEELEKDADRMAAELSMGGIGGGGGGDGMAMIGEIRREFPDTALWRAQVRTGPTGETQVTFELPDSLTTWVVDARAVTADTKVGSETLEFVVAKPLLIRPVTPRFFVAGDRPEVAAVVHNNTEEDLDVTASLEALGATVEGEAAQVVTVPAGGRTRVTWSLVVPATAAGEALLDFSVEGGGHEDATRPTLGRPPDQALPVYRFEIPDVMGVSGVLDEAGSRVEAIVVPPEAGPDTELHVRLEPSLAASLLSELTYIQNASYNSTEQIVSRFLPNVLTYGALQELGVESAALEEQLDLVVRDGLDRLYGRQNEDGGWGWWSDSASDPQISAYVALGLLRAEQAGFTVREEALGQTLDYLVEMLRAELQREPRAWSQEQAMALYVLTIADETWPSGVAGALYAARDDLAITGRAYLALAFGLADDTDRRTVTLLEDLRAEAEITASGAHWADAGARRWATDVRATAVVLDALVELAPDDPLVPQTVRWLMTARRADRRTSTQEVVWTLIALTDFMAQTGELDADYVWGVGLNGTELGEGQITPQEIAEVAEFQVGLSADPAEGLMPNATNGLELSRGEGVGRLYYRADLALYRSVEGVEAESRGIIVERTYCAVAGEEDENGECAPLSAARVGDLVEVRLTLTLPEMRHYLVLEDWYPAGMEPVDPTLLTEQQDQPAPGMLEVASTRWWWDPFDHRELRDEKALFFAQELPAGTYQVRYRLRAAIPGEYRVLPAMASEMYFPEVWGRTSGDLFSVQR